MAIWPAIRIGWLERGRRRAIREAMRARMRRAKLMRQTLSMPQALPLQWTAHRIGKPSLRGIAIYARRA
jgi:hypothetical protein